MIRPLLARLRRGGDLRGIVHGVFTSGAAVGVAAVLNYLVVILLSRLATKEQVGDFAFIVSTATVIATVCDFGMTNALTKAYHATHDPAEQERLLAMSLAIRGAFSWIAGLVCLATGDPDLRWVGILLFLWPGDTLIFFLNTRLDFNRAALLRIVAAALYLGAAIGLFVGTGRPELAAVARGLSLGLVGGGIALRVLRRASFRRWTWPALRRHLRVGLEFFALSTSSAITGHIDVLLVAWLMTREDLGLYRPLFTLGIVPTMLAMVVRIPLNAVVSSGRWRDRRSMLQTVHAVVGGVGAVSLVVVVVGALLAPWIVEFVLGPDYLPGVDIFRIVLLSSGIGAAVSPYGSFILMLGRVPILVVYGVLVAAGMVIADVVLIPLFGLTGAAWARALVTAMGGVILATHFYRGFLRDLERKREMEERAAAGSDGG